MVYWAMPNQKTYFNCAFWEVEPLLNNRCQFPDPSALLTQNILGLRGQDDDLSPGWSDSNFDTTVAIFSEFSSQELIQFSLEDTICDELKGESYKIFCTFIRLECFGTCKLGTLDLYIDVFGQFPPLTFLIFNFK
jgi:hypothetical protein